MPAVAATKVDQLFEHNIKKIVRIPGLIKGIPRSEAKYPNVRIKYPRTS